MELLNVFVMSQKHVDAANTLNQGVPQGPIARRGAAISACFAALEARGFAEIHDGHLHHGATAVSPRIIYKNRTRHGLTRANGHHEPITITRSNEGIVVW